jgi:sec-independent protein translocase protein TatA
MFGRIGPVEIILILIVLLLLFGAKRIPEIARSLGKSLSQFKRGLKDVEIDETGSDNEDEKDS